MEPSKKKADLKAKVIARLHEPLPLRAALCVALLAAWYYLGYTPMANRIAATTAKLERDRKRLALATEVEALRGKEAEFVDRLPPRSDPNEFLQYVLGGVRSGPLKLVSLSPEKPKDAAPFEVASVRLEVEGKYPDVLAFLHWVEADKRLLRVDGLSVTPDAKDREALKVQLTVLGLMGVEATPPADPAKAEAEPGQDQSKDAPAKPKGSPPKATPPAKKKG
jgi:Tfp pilus assembly protein PilO